MKRFKFASIIVPSLYVVSIGVIATSLIFMGKYMKDENITSKLSNYIPNKVVESETIKVVEPENETIAKPYVVENVEVTKDFYDIESDEENQIKSLIYYKNTYMQNTGVLYTSSETFDVVSVLDGTVTSITEDEILGKVVEVMHTNELITVYQCLSEINVKIGDVVKQNDVIGKSGNTNIDNGYANALMFEVNYKGSILNPNKFYEMNVKDLIGNN